MKKDWIRLLVSILVCQAAGIVGSFFTAPNIQGWYAGLEKPAFNLPNWLFAPVWTALFFLMGITLYLLWGQKGEGRIRKIALIFFSIQLGLNILWSVLFFGLGAPLLAFVEILVLWIMIWLTFLFTFRVNKTAGFLLVPYILWVGFAAVLNFLLWRLNI
jgi:benzodiazapine receptor